MEPYEVFNKYVRSPESLNPGTPHSKLLNFFEKAKYGGYPDVGVYKLGGPAPPSKVFMRFVEYLKKLRQD